MNQSGPAKFFPDLFFSVMIGIGRFPHGRNAVAIHSGLRRIYRKPSFYIRSTSQTGLRTTTPPSMNDERPMALPGSFLIPPAASFLLPAVPGH